MAKTLARIQNGDDMEGGESFCDDVYNNLKNHWRDNYGGEPCGSAALEYLQPGMIISDEYDDRLYHIILASDCPCSEIVQTCVPVSDDLPVYFGYDFDGAIYYDELTSGEFIIEAKDHADVEGITINLLETNQRFRIRQNSDMILMYHDGADGYIETNVGGGGLRFEYANPEDITFWEGIASGNPNFCFFGYITAGTAVRYGRFRIDDTFDELYIEAEANENLEGITVSLLEAAQEFRIRGVGGVERFHIDQTGILGYMRQGELFQWTYQGDLADDASFTLPAFTDACWGMIQAGDNEEYALFSVDNDGDVTLISNSANVVANADTEDKLCIGTAATQEGLVIRNRLAATKNINLIIWYS